MLRSSGNQNEVVDSVAGHERKQSSSEKTSRIWKKETGHHKLPALVRSFSWLIELNSSLFVSFDDALCPVTICKKASPTDILHIAGLMLLGSYCKCSQFFSKMYDWNHFQKD